MANLTETISKTNQSKSFITYGVILLVFIVALVLSTQREGPSKFPKVVQTCPGPSLTFPELQGPPETPRNHQKPARPDPQKSRLSAENVDFLILQV